MLRLASLPNDYAYPVQNNSGMAIQVIGFDVFTQTNTGNTAVGITGIYADNAGAGAQSFSVPSPTALATGLLTADGTAGWRSTITLPAVTVLPGECFWLQLEAFGRIAPPQMNGGVAGPAACYWRRANYQANAWVASGSVYNPILRVRCAAGGSVVPTLTSAGRPRLGTTINLDVAGGQPFLPAVMVFGLNNTSWLGMPLPVNLGLFGAPACDMWTSSNSFQLQFMDGAGQLAMPLGVPNIPGLAGVQLFVQAAPLAPNSNPLSLEFSNAGRLLLNP